MTPHPSRPGLGSTVIDIAIVAVVLAVLCGVAWAGVLLITRGVRAIGGRRLRRWPRNRGRRR